MHAPFNYTLRLFHVNLSPWWICEINEFIQINRSAAANNTLLILTSDAHLVTVMQMTIMYLSVSKAVWGITIIIASIYIYIYLYRYIYGWQFMQIRLALGDAQWSAKYSNQLTRKIPLSYTQRGGNWNPCNCTTKDDKYFLAFSMQFFHWAAENKQIKDSGDKLAS